MGERQSGRERLNQEGLRDTRRQEQPWWKWRLRKRVREKPRGRGGQDLPRRPLLTHFQHPMGPHCCACLLDNMTAQYTAGRQRCNCCNFQMQPSEHSHPTSLPLAAAQGRALGPLGPVTLAFCSVPGCRGHHRLVQVTEAMDPTLMCQRWGDGPSNASSLVKEAIPSPNQKPGDM